MTDFVPNNKQLSHSVCRPFLDYTRQELRELFQRAGFPLYRVDQVRRWVFARKTDSFTQMTDISKEHRQRLAEMFAGGLRLGSSGVISGKISDFTAVSGSRPVSGVSNNTVSSSKITDSAAGSDSVFIGKEVTRTGSPDGTEKLLIEWPDGHRVESVLLRDDRQHRTACISTQVGCAMGCLFCASGMDGFIRNLSRAELLEQFLRLNSLLPENERLTHLVVMGTGEPTLNLPNLLSALEEITASDGFDLGNRRVTISSVGIPDGIKKLAAANVPYKLAFSLHAPNDEIRDRIIPQNRRHPIAEVLNAADQYFQATGRRVTFEYILIDGLNDSREHALQLAGRIQSKTAVVNLIPCNPVPELPFKAPPVSRIHQFVNTLEQQGIQVKIRFRKGDDISAACGQLRRGFKSE